MLKARVIPCLDVHAGRVVKGVNFVDLVDAGDPVEQAKVYDAAGADELCFLDITASHEDRDTIYDVVARTAGPIVELNAEEGLRVRSGDLLGKNTIPVIVHGDAAFSGQGVVAETLNLAGLRGYATGGTIHVIVNNQIGFTTTPSEARSTLYCTDVAKMIQVPIFHVNGDDPEAVVYCVKRAMAYRQRFGVDVVIIRDIGHSIAVCPGLKHLKHSPC